MPKGGKQNDPPEIMIGLLGDGPDGEEGGPEHEVDDAHDEHEGLHAASREMLDAAQADDHEGHAKALADFLTIHKGLASRPRRKSKDDEGEDDEE